MKLVSRDSLFAGVHQVERHDPLAKGNVGTFKYRADLDRELLAAFGAHIHAVANVGLCPLFGRQFVGYVMFAMRADNAIRPAQIL